jgi:hypothetical protein
MRVSVRIEGEGELEIVHAGRVLEKVRVTGGSGLHEFVYDFPEIESDILPEVRVVRGKIEAKVKKTSILEEALSKSRGGG